MYERFLHEQLKQFVETVLLGFVAAYIESYICNQALMRLIENWKRTLDESFQLDTRFFL